MSSKFNERSLQGELLDSPEVPAHLLVQNLRELDFLNRKSGGHRISLEGIKMLMTNARKMYHIVDLGCGSGDLLRYLAGWASKNGFKVKLTGVDVQPGAISYLKEESTAYPEITGVTTDYRTYLEVHSEIDIIVCSLFCHHLNNSELLWLLSKIHRQSEEGFVINDLQRSPLAYYAAAAMTRILGGSTLSRHDGPVSVLRGFKKNELESLFKDAGVKNYIIQRRPFFRLLAVGGKRFRDREHTKMKDDEA
jgi:2-polyprenyl-3-methyl-5-hydroxy-6-metoxy-1,4-benzoquinol methylase